MPIISNEITAQDMHQTEVVTTYVCEYKQQNSLLDGTDLACLVNEQELVPPLSTAFCCSQILGHINLAMITVSGHTILSRSSLTRRP